MKSIAAVVLVVLFAGCELLPVLKADRTEGADPEATVWVVQDVVGGKQCAAPSFTPPDLEAQLEEAGVTVVREVVQPMVTCAACEICPAYAAQHFYEIDAGDLTEAEALGFEESEGPAGEG